MSIGFIQIKMKQSKIQTQSKIAVTGVKMISKLQNLVSSQNIQKVYHRKIP